MTFQFELVLYFIVHLAVVTCLITFVIAQRTHFF